MSLFGAFVKETCTVTDTEITLTGRASLEYLTFDEEFQYGSSLSYALYNDAGDFYSLGVGYFDDATTIIRRDVWYYDGVSGVAGIGNETVPAGTYYIVSTPHQYSTNELIREQQVGVLLADADDFTFTASTFRNRITIGTDPGGEFGDLTADMSEPLFSGQQVSFYVNNVTNNFQVTATSGLGIFGGDVGGLSPTGGPVTFEGLLFPGVGYFWRRVDAVSLSQAEWNTGTSTLHGIISPEKLDTKIRDSLNATGDAPMFACRAWVNFNSTGTLSVRASGNVSSVTDLSPGVQAINFTTAMVDANYVALISTGPNLTGHPQLNMNAAAATLAPTASGFSFRTLNQAHNAQVDTEFVHVAVFR